MKRGDFRVAFSGAQVETEIFFEGLHAAELAADPVLVHRSDHGLFLQRRLFAVVEEEIDQDFLADLEVMGPGYGEADPVFGEISDEAIPATPVRSGCGTMPLKSVRFRWLWRKSSWVEKDFLQRQRTLTV